MPTLGINDFERELRSYHLLLEDVGEFGGFNDPTGTGGGEGGATGTSGGLDSGGDGGSNTGFDINGAYADESLINLPAPNPEYAKAFEVYEDAYRTAIGSGESPSRAMEIATEAAMPITPAGQETAAQKANQQNFQKLMGVAAKVAAVLGSPTVAVAAFIAGLVSEGIERGINVDDVYDRMNEVADSGNVTPKDIAAAFPEFDTGGEGGSALAAIGRIASETSGATNVTGNEYDPLGPTPFTAPTSPYQDLQRAIGDPLTGGELPPAFEQYRADLSAAHVAGLKDILPEVFAETRETGIGAVGGITSVYQDLKVGTERRIGETVRQGELDARKLATEAYQQARTSEGQLAIGTTTPRLDYLKGIDIARISGDVSRDVAGAQLDAEKYGALFDIGATIFDEFTGT